MHEKLIDPSKAFKDQFNEQDYQFIIFTNLIKKLKEKKENLTDTGASDYKFQEKSDDQGQSTEAEQKKRSSFISAFQKQIRELESLHDKLAISIQNLHNELEDTSNEDILEIFDEKFRKYERFKRDYDTLLSFNENIGFFFCHFTEKQNELKKRSSSEEEDATTPHKRLYFEHSIEKIETILEGNEGTTNSSQYKQTFSSNAGGTGDSKPNSGFPPNMTQFDPKNYTIKEMKYYTDADIKQDNIDRTKRVEGKARDIHAVAGHVRDGILGSSQNVDGILKQIGSTNVNVNEGNDQLRIRAGNSHTKRLKMVLCLVIFAAVIITIYLQYIFGVI